MPKHAAPAAGNGNALDTSGRQAGRHAATGQGARDTKQVAKAGAGFVGKSAASGAARGAASGAALGSVVPGLGTGVGAATGAVAGGAGGALKGRSAKKTINAAKRGESGGSRRALIAEFAICILILALSPVARGEDEVTPKDWIKRGSAMCGLFIVLGLVSSAGPRAARAATAFGGLVTLVLLVDQREVFGVLTQKLKTTGAADADPDAGGIVGAGADDLVGGTGTGLGGLAGNVTTIINRSPR